MEFQRQHLLVHIAKLIQKPKYHGLVEFWRNLRVVSLMLELQLIKTMKLRLRLNQQKQDLFQEYLRHTQHLNALLKLLVALLVEQ